MKKRARNQPSTQYSSEPAVARGLMADNPLVQNASLGNKPNKVVPSKLGRASGLAGFVDKKRPMDKKFKAPSNPQKPKSGVIAPRPKVTKAKKLPGFKKLKGL